jgi:hypothetical protein
MGQIINLGLTLIAHDLGNLGLTVRTLYGGLCWGRGGFIAHAGCMGVSYESYVTVI